MAGQSSAMFGLSCTDASVLGSQVFGQAFMDSCGSHAATLCPSQPGPSEKSLIQSTVQFIK